MPSAAAIPEKSSAREARALLRDARHPDRDATAAPLTISAQASASDGVAGANPAATRMRVDSTGAA